MREMMEHLLTNKKRISTGVMFTEASNEAIDHIKKTYQPAIARVTRHQAAMQLAKN